MKEIFFILLLIIFIEGAWAQIDSSINLEGSIYTGSQSGKQLNKKERDNIIRKNLIGSWDWHNGIWQFDFDGTMRFFYNDTIRTSGKWKVKNGIFNTLITWPIQHTEWRNVVIYCSIDTIKFKRPNSLYPDNIIKMYRIKE